MWIQHYSVELLLPTCNWNCGMVEYEQSNPATSNGSFQVSFLFTTITIQRKVYQLCVFFGIGPVFLWTGSKKRKRDPGASIWNNGELLWGKVEKQNDVLHRGGRARLTMADRIHLDFSCLTTTLKLLWSNVQLGSHQSQNIFQGQKQQVLVHH